jgi:excisionase family DNA binding protein
MVNCMQKHKNELLQSLLITPATAAEILGVTRGTLQVWRSTGRYNLPYIKIGGKVMYKRTAVMAFIDAQSMDHTGKLSNSGEV